MYTNKIKINNGYNSTGTNSLIYVIIKLEISCLKSNYLIKYIHCMDWLWQRMAYYFKVI